MDALEFGDPEVLTAGRRAVVKAAAVLGRDV